jgi:hypothetical protein
METDTDPKVIRAQALLDKAPYLTAAEHLEVRAMLDFRVTASPREAWTQIGCSHDKFWKLVKAEDTLLVTYKDGPKSVRVIVASVWQHMMREAVRSQDRSRGGQK